jgi:hypothetical protein
MSAFVSRFVKTAVISVPSAHHPGQLAHVHHGAARADLGAEQDQGLTHHGVDVDRMPLQRPAAGARVLQERLHELARAGGGPPQRVEIAERLGVELVGEALHRGGRVGVDHDERREQLVRGLGREPLPARLLVLELADPHEQELPLRLRVLFEWIRVRAHV